MCLYTRLTLLIWPSFVRFLPSIHVQPRLHIHTPAIMAVTRRSTRLSAQSASNASLAAVPAPSLAPSSRKRKAAVDEPKTPTKRRTQDKNVPPPATHTPTAVGLSPHPHDGDEKPKSRAVTRIVDPEGTNAPLFSPGRSRLVANKDVESVSPSKVSKFKITTANLLEEANKYLVSVDERMKPLVEHNFCRIFSPEGLGESLDPFESLVSGIISQQVSGAAAKSIKAKFLALFGVEGDGFPHPSEVAARPIEQLRTAGLSQRKAEYVQGLAEKFVNGDLSAQMLHDAPYEEVLEKLVAVRGLGKWSVEMFACFSLKRMDIFSSGDLGVQRGMAAFVGRDVAKLKNKGGKWKYMSEKEMLEISERFSPYRSLFMWYMWKVEETDVSTME